MAFLKHLERTKVDLCTRPTKAGALDPGVIVRVPVAGMLLADASEHVDRIGTELGDWVDGGCHTVCAFIACCGC